MYGKGVVTTILKSVCLNFCILKLKTIKILSDLSKKTFEFLIKVNPIENI